MGFGSIRKTDYARTTSTGYTGNDSAKNNSIFNQQKPVQGKPSTAAELNAIEKALKFSSAESVAPKYKAP